MAHMSGHGRSSSVSKYLLTLCHQLYSQLGERVGEVNIEVMRLMLNSERRKGVGWRGDFYHPSYGKLAHISPRMGLKRRALPPHKATLWMPQTGSDRS